MSDKKYQHTGSKFVRLAEECAEIIHVCCKIERFGRSNYHPKDKKKTPNTVLLENELNDLIGILCRDFEGYDLKQIRHEIIKT